MHSELGFKAKLQGYAPRVCGIRYSQVNQPTSQATGEWVGDEKIAERRVATKASITSQSSPRVFSEIFCSTHPERGASQPPVQVPQNAKLTHQLSKLPSKQPQPSNSASFQSAAPARQHGDLPQSAALIHHADAPSQPTLDVKPGNQKASYNPFAVKLCAYCIANLPGATAFAT